MSYVKCDKCNSMLNTSHLTKYTHTLIKITKNHIKIILRSENKEELENIIKNIPKSRDRYKII